MKCADFQAHIGGSACHPRCESWARVDIRWSQTPRVCVYLDAFPHSGEISLTPQKSRSRKRDAIAGAQITPLKSILLTFFRLCRGPDPYLRTGREQDR
jgi:hypothetical protein